MHADSLIIITGVSGSGKSTALNALEDMGFFCIENLPAPLINHFVDFLMDIPEKKASSYQKFSEISAERVVSRRFALLVDCRREDSFPQVRSAVGRVREAGIEVSLLFFDAQDDIIIRRFQETRRPHPLLVTGPNIRTVAEALSKERKLLTDFREAASRIIDTTSYTPHDLRKVIEQYVGKPGSLTVCVESFGFKYGIPHDVDLVVDVRFLPNPHFVPELQGLTGAHQGVREYVFQKGYADEFLKHYTNLLQFLVPRYKAEGKRYLTIGIGCTGGRHRSVAVGIRLATLLADTGIYATLRHRDLER